MLILRCLWEIQVATYCREYSIEVSRSTLFWFGNDSQHISQPVRPGRWPIRRNTTRVECWSRSRGTPCCARFHPCLMDVEDKQRIMKEGSHQNSEEKASRAVAVYQSVRKYFNILTTRMPSNTCPLNGNPECSWQDLLVYQPMAYLWRPLGKFSFWKFSSIWSFKNVSRGYSDSQKYLSLSGYWEA